ncbi:MAG: hypothetical protein K0S65_760 [Labilithrix sp.]|nr:hypothetical protein [Labilithrix sp.]
MMVPMRREPSSLPRLVAGLVLAGVSTMAVLGGCGSRGPLDDATNAVADAAPEATVTTSIDAGPEATPPVADAGRDAGPVACGLCVITNCGDTILSCLQADACRGVFQCVATTCLGSGGGGGLNPLCLFQCAGDDPSGALGVLSVFQCITGGCGGECGGLLGGLGGLGGGGGGGGGGMDGAPEFREIFSPWPELLSPAPGHETR